MRRAYADKCVEQERRERAETRQEHLQTAKERLQYDLNMSTSSCRPAPADDDRSALHRGLQGEAGGAAPMDSSPVDSPPPTLPPGAPSSSASSTAPAAEGQEGEAGIQSSGHAPVHVHSGGAQRPVGVQGGGAPPPPKVGPPTPDRLATTEVTETFLKGLLADEEARAAH